MRFGLIRGRHGLPVDRYIFDGAIEDIHDYSSISKAITSKLLVIVVWRSMLQD